MTLLTLGSGPLVAFLVQKFGHRWITLLGKTHDSADSGLSCTKVWL
jgi:hypothetical protein